MRTPSPPYCRLNLAPPLADRFIVEVAPIDYGPVLLLMPFGSHLTMDTLPSGNRLRWLQVRLGCVQLSPSCPFRLLHTCLSPGPARHYPRALLIRAPEGLQPSRSTRCSAHSTPYLTMPRWRKELLRPCWRAWRKRIERSTAYSPMSAIGALGRTRLSMLYANPRKPSRLAACSRT